MNTGNAGLGICIPPSSSMFLMLGLLVVAGSVAAGDLYIALMCGGLWSLAYRLLLTRYYVSKYNIPAVPKDRIVSLSSALKEGGTSLTMFLGIIVPLVVITGPVGNFLKTLPAFGEDGVDAMNIIIWVPVLIMFICIIEGRKSCFRKLPPAGESFSPPPQRPAAPAEPFPSLLWPEAML